MSSMTKVAFVLVLGLLISSGHAAVSRGESSRDASRFTYTRLYCSPEGGTHFQDVTVELRKISFAPPAAPIYIGGDVPASSAFFGGFDAG